MPRRIGNQRRHLARSLFVSFLLLAILTVVAVNIFADIITDNDVEVRLNSRLTYYLTVQEDGVDVDGVESSDTQMANLTSGRISVTDRIPDGLIFQGFVTTPNGKIGASSRADSSIACSGVVVDDTNEAAVDTGTWNNDNTAYYYHGLHYDVASRTVSFKVEKLKAGCELTVGIITKTPSGVDDPDTQAVETRRDFYNNALASEKDLTSISNTVHAYIESTETLTYPVTYSYTGDVPAGAPAAPTAQSYPASTAVTVATSPTLAGYTFSGWTTADATITNGSFAMPTQAVNFVGIWVKDAVVPTYTVTYVIDGAAPADYLAPGPKSYAASSEVSLNELQAGDVIDGYRFSGWTTTDATISGSGFTMPENDVTIHGSFTRISYTVCYEFEGSTLPPNAESLLPACTNHYPGDTVTTAANPTAEGYEFVGWYKNATFTMPEKNVVIYGEWGLAPAGKFAPTLAKVILNPKDQYDYGDTVQFKVTITNTAEYAIHDVYVSELLAGAVIEESPNNSYGIVGSDTASIASIAPGASVEIFASYRVRQNKSQTLTNTVKLTGALADNNHVLDQSQEYTASITFTTVAEPAPLTGIIFDALPYVGIIALALVGLLLARIKPSHSQRSVSRLLCQVGHVASRIKKSVAPARLLCGALAISLLLGSTIIHSVMAENYTEIIKSISLTSAHTSFENNEGGAWNVTKSAKWTSGDTARITFDVESIAKVRENEGIDVVLVMDTSGSMVGQKIERVKSDAVGFAEEVIANRNGRVAIVSFGTTATIKSGFTNNLNTLSGAINELVAVGETNYNAGLTKASEVLTGYEAQPNRDLTLLFLTDGVPNLDTPNQNAAYRILKANHPNMLISGIQYEMGDSVANSIKEVSDQQFIADMTTLSNALIEALHEPINYGDFILTDYINDDYWEVVGSSNINITNGNFELTENNGAQIITWDMSRAYESGMSAQMTIDVRLKADAQLSENSYLPTNKRESVLSSLVDTPNENIESANTPVLKARYNVSYDANLPSDCASYNGTIPQGGSYVPLSTVLVPANSISCDGYNFMGWQSAQGELLNGDYLKLQNGDVALKGIWSKVSIKKAMDGIVHSAVSAQLDTGSNINLIFKQLAGQTTTDNEDLNYGVNAVKAASSMPAGVNAIVISSSGSEIPIYAWFDSNDGTIYIYSEAGTIKANENMDNLLNGFMRLTDASGISKWDTSETKSLNSAFARTGLRDLDDLIDWDVSNVQKMQRIFLDDVQLADISGLSYWDVDNVTSFVAMFAGAESLADLNPIANWNTGNALDMQYMFSWCKSLENLDALANWDTSKVMDMQYMFGDSSTLQDIEGISNWDLSSLLDMSNMFINTPMLTDLRGLEGWDTSSVMYMNNMFEGSGITDVDELANWDVRAMVSAYGMFSNAVDLTDISGLASWETNSLTDTSGMFFGTTLTDLNDLSGWDMSHVTRMPYMFMNMPNLSDISGLSEWDTGSVTSMTSLFHNTPNIEDIDALSEWDTSNVTDMSNMFHGTVGLKDISGASNWDTGNVTDLSYMFAYGYQITSLTVLNGWDTHSVLEKGNMFLNIPDYIERPSWWDL